jgi:uncharacterized Tic20 family protein
MTQPDLGLTVARLRLQKGFTQEKLAELCEVSTRTIQRIESGEADPRTFTINCLANILEFDFHEDNQKGELFWIAAMHISSIFCIPLIPLLIWSLKKGDSIKIDDHGKMALNFQLSMTIYLVSMALLYTVLVPTLIIFMEKQEIGWNGLFVTLSIGGILPLISLGIFCFIQGLSNATRVLTGKNVRYYLTIPFIK